jgi:hypothetical protein
MYSNVFPWVFFQDPGVDFWPQKTGSRYCVPGSSADPQEVGHGQNRVKTHGHFFWAKKNLRPPLET